MKPEIICTDLSGYHNNNVDTIKRLKLEGMYKDLSTIIITPGFGQVPTKCVSSWMSLMTPPNGRVVRLWPMNMEVGEAFSQTIENCLSHPELNKFKYCLTLEHDNVCPSDGLVKLLSKMEQHPEFAAIGGLYYTKGYGGVAQIWGNPHDPIPNYRPQLPVPGELVECCGIGMGFSLFRMDMFKDQRIERPLFKTLCSATEGSGTQDLAYWSKVKPLGYRCAIDCSVLVGHYDYEGKFGAPDTVW
jgi:hypothetical protein